MVNGKIISCIKPSILAFYSILSSILPFLNKGNNAVSGNDSTKRNCEVISNEAQKRQPTESTELENEAQETQPTHALPSALKKSSAFPATHRRVFSHGQITFSSPLNTMGETVVTGSELLPNASTSTTSKPHIYKDDEDNHKLPNKNISHIPPTAFKKGHRRGDSKTEFILPPGHEERERKRALQRSVGAVNYHNYFSCHNQKLN